MIILRNSAHNVWGERRVWARSFEHTHTYVHTHTHTEAHTDTLSHSHTCTQIHTHTHTHTHTQTHSPTVTLTHIRTHAHIHTLTYVHANTHSHSYIHKHPLKHTCKVIHVYTHSYTHTIFTILYYRFRVVSLFYGMQTAEYLSLPPTRHDLTQGQKPEGRMQTAVGYSMSNTSLSKDSIIIIIINIYSFRVFCIIASWWFSTEVWVIASLLKSPGLFSVFWLFSTML